MLNEFRMPDAGEGLTEAEVVAWHVAIGDVVAVNQVLLEVETAKAVVELPSPYAGTVRELLAAPGDVVPVGTPIVRIEDDQPAPAPADHRPTGTGSGPGSGPGSGQTGPEPGVRPVGHAGPAVPTAPVNEAFGPEFGTRSVVPSRTAPEVATPERPAEEPAAASGAAPAAQESRQSVLVGYGVRAGSAPHRRPRTTPHGAERPEAGPPGTPARPVRYGGLEQARAVEQRLADRAVLAKPPVRRLARDLGIDLRAVTPTGPGGSITHDDVTRASADTGSPEVVRLSHVDRAMAEAMTRSAASAVQVTEWVDVEVTAMAALIRAARRDPRFADVPVTPLTFAALGLVRAAVAYPKVNSTLDETGTNLLMHRGVHLGIAVDSPRGLLVPHIRHAERLGLVELAEQVGSLVATARAGRSSPSQLRGSTITLTNVGVFGVDAGTPIIYPDQVAILALGRVLARPWVVDGQVVARDVVTLALSFDHRVVDGALGSRVLRSVADFMADPATALALGG